MFKSFTNQRNAKSREQRPQQLVMDLPVALPNNIKDAVKQDIYEVVAATPFQKLSIPVTAYQRDVEDEVYSNNGRKPNPDRTTNIGFVKKFEDDSFQVIVFERYAKAVSSFATPAIEIIYADNYNGLARISKFNIIDLGDKKPNKDKKFDEAPKADKRETDNTTPEAPVEEAVEVVEEPKPAGEEPLTVPIADMMADMN